MIFDQPVMVQMICSKPVEIKDSEGNLFYIAKPKNGKAVFNLPRGSYSIAQFLPIKVNKRRLYPYKLIRLPKKDRNLKAPKKFKLTFGENPSKATVNLIEGTVFFDKEFYSTLKRIEKDFILAHERAHYFYKGGTTKKEQVCDAFAANKLLTMGYNPSQIDAAQKNTLHSKGSKNRIKLNLKDLENVTESN